MGGLVFIDRVCQKPVKLTIPSDSYNNRVQVFTQDGVFLQKWGGMGLWGGRFRVASDIAFDPAGHVYIADFYNNRIQLFDADGTYRGQMGAKGEKPGDFDGATGIAISPSGCPIRC